MGAGVEPGVGVGVGGVGTGGGSQGEIWGGNWGGWGEGFALVTLLMKSALELSSSIVPGNPWPQKKSSPHGRTGSKCQLLRLQKHI